MDQAALAAFFDRPREALQADPDWPRQHEALLAAMEAGMVRAAERAADGRWHAVPWVKQAILLAFARTALQPVADPTFAFFDKPAFPPRAFALADRVRIVPGGTMIRRGSHLGPGVVVMPPAFVNMGAFVDSGAMLDSHTLVGSCAQIGKNVHLAAGAQIGGVLEPPQACPVIVEDDCFVGALAGVFEGVIVRQRAVLAAGVVLTAATAIFDLVHGTQYRGEVPANAVVVPGTRPARGAFAQQHGLSVATPLIVKYRDAGTDAATALVSVLH
ncbi:MAG: 2,3,4,5-tetrahydropyridine-2,6-dicarboxylate N-succinyltransferase [Planctomycetes bacterium]|nr:2,3,4,5-tetrahydropyridine-2,6-dicarboxylate N-succinyltransferase [Planctomycetota bacterium]